MNLDTRIGCFVVTCLNLWRAEWRAGAPRGVVLHENSDSHVAYTENNQNYLVTYSMLHRDGIKGIYIHAHIRV